MLQDNPSRNLLEAPDAYAWGASGANECPTKYFRIMSEEACRNAAIAFGKTYGGITPQRSDRPRGCFWNTDAGGFTVFINLDAVGSGYPDRLLLCSGARLSARTPHEQLAHVGRSMAY